MMKMEYVEPHMYCIQMQQTTRKRLQAMGPYSVPYVDGDSDHFLLRLTKNSTNK